ncbi:MAG: efflux RND transporter periplasmic adaptor subunit [Bacteroidia bacterium]|nr:efflux RND transporter periplasmic adaptor subunit [Bacteroidia bacterium]
MKNILLFASFIPALAVLSCKSEPAEATEAEATAVKEIVLTAEQFKTAGIETGPLQTAEMGGSIRCNGMVDAPPQNLVSVSVPVGGIVKSTDMLQGMRIRKGDVLAVLEHPDYIKLQQSYLEDFAALTLAESEYKRQQELSSGNINARRDLEKAEAAMLTARARSSAGAAQLQLLGLSPESIRTNGIAKSIRLTAPISGYVTKVNVNVGKFAAPNDVLFELVDTEHLHVELTVYETDLPFIREGQNVRVIIQGQDDSVRTAKVFLIGREIHTDRTIRIHGHLDKEDPHLLPGMFVKAEIETGAHPATALPVNAVVSYGGKSYVFVAAGNNRFTPVEVTTGNHTGTLTEVRLPEGVSRNAKFVTSGAYALLSAMFNAEEEE